MNSLTDHGSGEGRLSIRDVGKIYDPEGVHVVALERCSLEIEPGGFVAVVGPSGCGKSTLLNVLAGFDHLTSGEVDLDGQPLAAIGRTPVPGPDRVVVFQNGALFPWFTVLDNITYGPVRQRLAVPGRCQRARDGAAREHRRPRPHPPALIPASSRQGCSAGWRSCAR